MTNKKMFDALAGANTLPSEDLAVMTGRAVDVVVMGDYDYGKLGDRELARWAEGEEVAIKRELVSMEGDLDAIESHRRAIANHETSAVEGALSIGKRLAAVKEKLPHGEFQPWVKAAFETATGLSYRTAVRWMGIAEQFGHRPELVAEMGIKVAGLLATRLDDGEADAVLAAVESHLQQGEKLTPAVAKELKQDVQGIVSVATLERFVSEWLNRLYPTKRRQYLVLMAHDTKGNRRPESLLNQVRDKLLEARIGFVMRDLVSAVKNLLEQARQQEREAAKPALRSDEDWADALEYYINTQVLSSGGTLKARYDAVVFMHPNGSPEQREAFKAAGDWIMTHYRPNRTAYAGFRWEMENARHLLIGTTLRWLIEKHEGVQVEPLVVIDAELFEQAKATNSADKLAGSNKTPSLRGVFEYEGRMWVSVASSQEWTKCYRVHPDGEIVEPGMPSRGVRMSYLGLKVTHRGKTYTFGSQELHVHKPESQKTAVAPSEDAASPDTHAQDETAQTAGAAPATSGLSRHAGWVRHASELIVEALQEKGDVEICLDVHAVLERAAKFLEAAHE